MKIEKKSTGQLIVDRILNEIEKGIRRPSGSRNYTAANFRNRRRIYCLHDRPGKLCSGRIPVFQVREMEKTAE